MDLVSIIIPVYNVENYLEECINSIINQTYKNIEIILVNDGSSDNSGSICDKFKEKYNNIKVIHQKNSGVSNARNNGKSISNGKYIMFIDSDDYLEKDAIETLVKYDYDLVCFGHNRVYRNKIIHINYSEKEKEINNIKKEVLLNHKIGGFLWNKLFKKDIIDNNNIKFNNNIHYCEDLLFVIDYLKHVNNCYYINKCFYNYRMRYSGISFGKCTIKNISALDAYSTLIDNIEDTDIKKRIEYFYLVTYYRLKKIIPKDYKIRNELIDNEKEVLQICSKKELIKFNIIKKYNFINIFKNKLKNIIYKLYE